METVITPENLHRFAYVSENVCPGPVRGIVLSFFGLGGCKMYDEDLPQGMALGQKGILYVVPYSNPWSWMNRQQVAMTEEILAALRQKLGLPETLPIVSSGGSMGGLAALVYTRYARQTPAACVANCPVCDLVYHYGERPDLPRTLYSAFWGYDGTLEEAMKTASPLHLAPQMPKIPYHIFHCGADQSVNLHRHSETFVAEMKRLGHDITLYVDPGRSHCDLSPEMYGKYMDCCIEAVG